MFNRSLLCQHHRMLVGMIFGQKRRYIIGPVCLFIFVFGKDETMSEAKAACIFLYLSLLLQFLGEVVGAVGATFLSELGYGEDCIAHAFSGL